MRPALSIVIPCFNEAERLPASLRKIEAYLVSDEAVVNAEQTEILVVDDGSSDDTAKLASEFSGVQVEEYGGNRGKGFAVRYGFGKALGQRVLMTDADLSTPIEDLGKLWSVMDQGYGIVMGSRALDESRVVVAQAAPRQLAGKTFNLIIRAMLGVPFRDTQCGFKLFDKEACLPVFAHMRIDGFAFDVEAVYLAKKYGVEVTDVPVDWYNSETSKVDFFRDSLRMFKDVARIRRMHP